MDAINEIMNIGSNTHNMIIKDKEDNNLEKIFYPTNVG
jgi:hypothetical protein